MKAATAAFEEYSTAIEDACEAVKKAGAHLQPRRWQNYRIVSTGAVNLITSWRARYVNSLEDVFLEARFYKGFPQLEGFYPSIHEAQQLKHLRYAYELTGMDRYAYVGKDEQRREFSPTQLADHLLQLLMDLSDKNHPD